jgi:hypothetical protein
MAQANLVALVALENDENNNSYNEMVKLFRLHDRDLQAKTAVIIKKPIVNLVWV